MSKFTIEMEPAPPEISTHREISLDGIDFGKVYEKHPEQYDVTYRVDGVPFGYYPASIITIVDDLYHEWELIRSRQSHEMTLSGYRVLDMKIQGEEVNFENPTLIHEENKKIGPTFSASYIEEIFRSITERVLNIIWSDA